MSKVTDEERLNVIIEMISKIAGLDFSMEAIVDDDVDNPLNTIGMGLNMLAEELESNVVTKSELERKNADLEQAAAKQREALLEMSTPITQLWDGILLLPLVGIVDSKRAQNVLSATLNQIVETRSTVFILDISGVAVLDTEVANHLFKITKATKLMGCTCIISGISPAVAQTIVELGVDMEEIRTTGTMKDAMDQALGIMGIRLNRADAIG